MRDPASSFRSLGGLGCTVLAVSTFVFSATLAGCDEEPPPPAAGAFSIAFVPGSQPGECRLMTHAAAFGVVTTSGIPSTVPADANNAVSCSIKKSGDAFALSVNASSNGYTFGAKVATFPASATFDAPATGTVSYTSPQTQDTFVSTDCKFWLIPENGQFVKDGSAWFSFKCDAITSEGRTCALDPSFVKFENCDSLADEE